MNVFQMDRNGSRCNWLGRFSIVRYLSCFFAKRRGTFQSFNRLPSLVVIGALLLRNFEIFEDEISSFSRDFSFSFSFFFFFLLVNTFAFCLLA